MNLHPDHLADLKRSGLSDETIEQAGIISVTPDQIIERLGSNIPGLSSAYEIPYPGCAGYSRFRCFYEEGKFGPMYFQPKDTKPRLYIPAAPVADLPANSEVYITWGEKRALKAHQEGLICIGIGGVRDWDDGNGGLIPDFDSIDLKNCIVHIVPDNDWKFPNTDENSNGMEQSVNQLAAALCDRRVRVKIINLPEGPEKGLDDYLCLNSADDFKWLPVEFANKKDSQVNIEPFIVELNQCHSVVNFSGRFAIMEETIDQSLGHHKIQFSSAADFKNFYAHRFVYRPQPTKGDKMVKMCIADAWIKSPQRREYKGIVFEPMEDVPGYYNLWQGFAVEPKEGNWSPLREHIRQIICRGDKNLFQWVIAWMARIVQEPGKDRPETCLVLLGGQGAGKGIFVREFGKLFGEHFLHLISIEQITGRFNSHLADKLLVFCDEALWDGNKKASGIIKASISEPTLPVEYKFKDLIRVKNYTNYIIASNSDWVVPAEEKERRFCVLDVSPEKAGDIGYFKKIVDQMKSGGREAMLCDLQKHDIAGINLRIIPKTHALTKQVLYGLGSVPQFWLHCLNDPDSLPKIKEDDRFCVIKSDLYDSYRNFYRMNSDKTLVPANSFGKTIRKYCPGIQDGRSSMGNRPTLYILPPLKECRSQFEKAIGMTGVFES